jgi:hypothetical protein
VVTLPSVSRHAARQYLCAMLCCPLYLHSVRNDRHSIDSLLRETDVIVKFATDFDGTEKINVESCKDEPMMRLISNSVSLYLNIVKGRTNAQQVFRGDVQSRVVTVF